ncbi:MAG: hypothetical protein HY289_03900 [Planctomycetes bacterium]|nr:hypothetical protein [Planctomycetota bacterium]
MAIPFYCDCGRAMRVKDELAGRKIRCPACGEVLTVPKNEPPKEVDDAALDVLLTESPAEKRRPGPMVEGPDEGEETRVTARPTSKLTRTQPKKLDPTKSAALPRSERRERSEPWLVVSPSVITGLLMMVRAVVWFFGALAAGWIFFYPPILFVLGIAAVFRGLTGREDE